MKNMRMFLRKWKRFLSAGATATRFCAGNIKKRLRRNTAGRSRGTGAFGKIRGVYLGDTTKKVIYLTFDEGYENGYTSKILDVLRDNNVKAVFFITGPYLNEHEDLVRRMVEEGHVVGNHTVHHPAFRAFQTKNLKRKSWGLTEPFMKNSVST